MTWDVYAQLEHRGKREHGVRFDALVRSAEAQLHGAEIASHWATSGRRDADSDPVPAGDGKTETENPLSSRGFSERRGPESNWRHHDFQARIAVQLPGTA